ncbi:glycosyltransferase [Patescibacteria group bacterium]|nr:glycosyltransferase [Patescibacteria group bacterium]
MPNLTSLVSVVLPIYNSDKYLLTCLKSIESQTLKSIQLIAIDDGSTDSSWTVLQQFAKNKPWIKISQNSTNLGVSPTFNRAVKKATGQFLARIDADDIMHKNRLKLQLHYLRQHPNTVIVGGQCQIINPQGKNIGKKTFPLEDKKIKDMLFRTVPLQQPTIMINKKLLPKNFVYSNKKYSPAEDYGLFFASAPYGQFANLPQTTLSYREHSTNISLVNPKFTFWRIWRARLDGVFKHHYKPSLNSLITVLAQTIAIILLPQKLIYVLHKKLRRMD